MAATTRKEIGMTTASVGFKAVQQTFARYIRDPANNPPPSGVKPERMAMYRELIFNNIDGFLANNFPVIRQLLDDTQWFELLQDFFAKHICKTPHFSEIAEEFLDYLENERNNPDDFPFLLELAHYEWVEMALSISKETIDCGEKETNNLETASIQLSPLAWPLIYQFPVHLIAPDYVPTEAPEQPVCLLAYRDLTDDVKFIEINAITYRMLEIIQEHGPILTADCLNRIMQASAFPNSAAVAAGGLQTLKELAEKKVILLS